MNWLAWIISPFKPKARAFVRGRRQALASLNEQLSANREKLLWVHASSIGEYEQGRPVMERFKEQYPDFKILVSFYSPSGYEAVSTNEIVDYTCYLPHDSRRNARRFLDIAKPRLAFFIKYEFWHFYLDELSKRNIPVYSISAIFRQSQVFFKWYGGFFRNMLLQFNQFFVQDETSQQLLKSLDIDSIITGDTRLDRVIEIRDTEVSLPILEKFSADQAVFIVGSMRKEDFNLITEFIRRTRDYKFIIAPHEITEEMMTPLEEQFDCARYTQQGIESFTGQVLILDTMGILSKVYRYGEFAYVGGGFSDGLHNILEPAVYKLPVFFGNMEYTRFKEALDLTTLGTAFAIGTADEMVEIHEGIVNNADRKEQIEEGLTGYLNQNKGASDKIIAHLPNFTA